jgi:hypothetical protein
MSKHPDPNTPDWNEQASSPDPEKRKAVAASDAAPAAMLRALAEDEHPDVRRAVAANPNTPLEVLWALAEEMPETVATNRALRLTVTADPGVLAQAPVDPLCALLAEEAVPEAWLQWGSRQEGWDYREVRQAVASNPSTPPEALEKLAEDSVSDVRRAVASNPAAPAEALERLAGDLSGPVRLKVARNAATPTRLLNRLQCDENEWVAHWAQLQLSRQRTQVGTCLAQLLAPARRLSDALQRLSEPVGPEEAPDDTSS